jgi:hypothetical protein
MDPTPGDVSTVTFVLPSVVLTGLSGLALLFLFSLIRRSIARSRFSRRFEPQRAERLSGGWRRPGPSRAPPLAFA